jgi:hypothetical protein
MKLVNSVAPFYKLSYWIGYAKFHIFVNRPLPSYQTELNEAVIRLIMALWFTQPLTEMSTRN